MPMPMPTMSEWKWVLHATLHLITGSCLMDTLCCTKAMLRNASVLILSQSFDLPRPDDEPRIAPLCRWEHSILKMPNRPQQAAALQTLRKSVTSACSELTDCLSLALWVWFSTTCFHCHWSLTWLDLTIIIDHHHWHWHWIYQKSVTCWPAANTAATAANVDCKKSKSNQNLIWSLHLIILHVFTLLSHSSKKWFGGEGHPLLSAWLATDVQIHYPGSMGLFAWKLQTVVHLSSSLQSGFRSINKYSYRYS